MEAKRSGRAADEPWQFGTGAFGRYHPRQVIVITGSLFYGTNTVATLGDRQVTVCPTIDTDRDGLLGGWKTRFGLDPANSANATQDLDADRMSNLGEYVADTIINDS
jgi:hypothetical protein